MGRVIYVATDQDFRDELRAKELCDSVGPVLAMTYPGYRWRTEALPKQGIIRIRCEMTNASFGYVLKLRNWFSATQWRELVVKAGGEILERSNLNRRGFDENEFRQAPRDCAGRLIGDLSA